MKKMTLLAVGLSAGLMTMQAFAADTATAISLKNQKDKVSYAIGNSIGENFKAQGMDVDPAIIAKGIEDVIKGNKPVMTKQEIQDTMVNFQKDMIAKRKKVFEEQSAKNKQEGDKFLNQNKSKTGVKESPTGLQYTIVEEGNGAAPGVNDLVTVDYEGKLLNGTVFDSSYKRGKPVTFQVSQVIPGWTEALKMMKPGATWQVYIPPKLAYGEQGVGGMIGPNQTLVFKIHLISVNKPNQKQPDATSSSTSDANKQPKS